MATNIAAISYIGRKVGNSRQVFLTGLLYTLGRTLAYLALAVVLVASVLSVPQISLFLQKYMHLALGPLLIIVGMFLLGLIELSMSGGGIGEGLQKRVDAMGIWGALLLGIVFALTFCPTSAALFFGSLIPLSLKVNSSVTLPAVYGVATGLPVLVFALLIAFGVKSLSGVFGRVTRIELWARRITGAIFIGVGLYKTLQDIFGLLV